MPRARTAKTADPGPAPREGVRRWLLFVHQLPASPSNLRVRTWRRLQQLGAMPVKQAVYVLPDTPETREDFEWLKTEVTDAGGDATVFTAGTVDARSDESLVEEFRRARQESYGALGQEIERVLGRVTATRRRRGTRAPSVERLAQGFQGRLAALERIDFFGSAGRDRVVMLLRRFQEGTRTPGTAPKRTGLTERPTYRQRLWVTRPRPGVDRMASAWLIRRFIDLDARFGFAADLDHLPAQDAVAFDMFGADFSHQGEGCTFETLCAVFGVEDPAVARLAAIVHDLDLKDGRHGAVEAPTVGAIIEGLQLANDVDDVLLERGIDLFESLYLAFARSALVSGPRPVAARHRPATRSRPNRTSRRRSRP